MSTKPLFLLRKAKNHPVNLTSSCGQATILNRPVPLWTTCSLSQVKTEQLF